VARIQTDLGKIPGPVFINNVAAVRLIWTLPNGKEASNVLHASGIGTADLTQGQIDAKFAAIQAAFSGTGSLQTCLHQETTLQGIGVRNLSPIGSPPVAHGEVTSSESGIAGTLTDNPLPQGIAFVVSLRTAQGGQQGRGRVFFGGFTEAMNTADGDADPAVFNGARSFLLGVQAALNAGTPALQLCIAHPARAAYTGRSGAEHPARDAGFVPVTSIVTRDHNWDTVRLRQRR
jgi:hypothetical protein